MTRRVDMAALELVAGLPPDWECMASGNDVSPFGNQEKTRSAIWVQGRAVRLAASCSALGELNAT